MSDVNKYLAGFERFRKKYFEGKNDLFDRLRVAQEPQALVIACSDSRVDPAILFDSEPGELFVIRNVANLVPPHAGDHGTHGVSAALEFAVCNLEVKDIIVLGHSQCGGIRALLSGAGGEYVTRWMSIASEVVRDKPAIDPKADSPHRTSECEKRAVLLSVKNLISFPWIRERVEKGRLAAHGWYFDIDSGRLEQLDRAPA